MMTSEEQAYLVALGKTLFTKRKSLRITQEQMAKRVKITRNHIHRIESGESPTSILTLRRIVKELGLDSMDIMKNI
jgi:transcriptional regulator with XRE-family HTH domain